VFRVPFVLTRRKPFNTHIRSELASEGLVFQCDFRLPPRSKWDLR